MLVLIVERKSQYYSLDDPALFRPSVDRESFMDGLMRELIQRAGRKQVFLLLDEVQRLERWELFLKKYYDLKYPVRLVVSGSASSPIFKKSRESLLGRVKDYHLLPFSFREFLLFKYQDKNRILNELKRIYEDGEKLMGMMAGAPQHLNLEEVTIRPLSYQLWSLAEKAFQYYLYEGGFPEVWELRTWEQKTDYLFDNQVKKVVFEDLLLAAEFRKPELLKRFYISLLEQPGREVNFSQIAKETGVLVAQVEKYLPLLEMTDLINHVEKFRKSPLRVRRGNVKFYLVDLTLRNAVLRLQDGALNDLVTLGLYAENLVFNALRKWRGTVAMDYYREGDSEVDFVVHVGPHKYLPFEVKYRDPLIPKGISARSIPLFGGFAVDQGSLSRRSAKTSAHEKISSLFHYSIFSLCLINLSRARFFKLGHYPLVWSYLVEVIASNQLGSDSGRRHLWAGLGVDQARKSGTLWLLWS